MRSMLRLSAPLFALLPAFQSPGFDLGLDPNVTRSTAPSARHPLGPQSPPLPATSSSSTSTGPRAAAPPLVSAGCDPRIPIYATSLPLVISQSGSYYFAENISTTGGGITVDANDVTLDLMGFTLDGGTGSGILQNPARKGLVIQNGIVSGWQSHGIEGALDFGGEATVRSVVARGNGAGGIQAQIVLDCTAIDNAGSGNTCGIRAELVRGSRAENNYTGMDVGSHASDCSVRWNVGDGVRLSSGTLAHCTSEGNGYNGIVMMGLCTVADCSVTYNTYHGIGATGDGSVIRDCHAVSNGLNGIYAVANTNLIGNECSQNGDAGIRVFGPPPALCRLDQNHAANNGGYGFHVLLPGNVLVRNTASGNPVNFSIVAGNASIVAPALAFAGPWDNVEF